MSNLTTFSFNLEDGFVGTIGKMSVKEKKDGTNYMDLMIFLAKDGEKDIDNKIEQIFNANFPQAAFKRLESFKVGDFVCIKFDRMVIAKGISNKTKEEVQYTSVRALSIKKVEYSKKAEVTPPKQEADENWGEK